MVTSQKMLFRYGHQPSEAHHRQHQKAKILLCLSQVGPKILAELLRYEVYKNLIEEFNTDPQPTSGDLFDHGMVPGTDKHGRLKQNCRALSSKREVIVISSTCQNYATMIVILPL